VDAEDISQEVFIRAWNAIGRYKITGAPFSAWLISIAHNLIVDHYRASRRLVSLEDSEASRQTDDETNPEAMTEASLKRDYVRGAILKLKGERQQVVLMRFIDGLSYSEIARALKKSEGAVRVIQYRALNDLRHLLVPGA